MIQYSGCAEFWDIVIPRQVKFQRFSNDMKFHRNFDNKVLQCFIKFHKVPQNPSKLNHMRYNLAEISILIKVALNFKGIFMKLPAKFQKVSMGISTKVSIEISLL